MNVLCPKCNVINESKNLSCNKCNNKLMLQYRYFLLNIISEKNTVSYLAYSLKLNKEVLIKEFSLLNTRIWQSHDIFKKESDILSQLNYHAIPKFIESFETDTKSYTVMQYVNGITLKEEQKRKRYTENEIIDDIIQIAKILDYLHNLIPPIIHQDLNLDNIIRRKDGKLFLVDFNSVEDTLKKDRSDNISGTYGVIAPEQLMGKAVIASDYYSLGIIILMLLTKKEPEEMIDINNKLNWKSSVKVNKKIIHLLEKLLEESYFNRISSLKEIENILFEKKDGRNIATYNTKSYMKSYIFSATIMVIVMLMSFFFMKRNRDILKRDSALAQEEILEKINLQKRKNNLKKINLLKEQSEELYNQAIEFFDDGDIIGSKIKFDLSCKFKNAKSCYRLGKIYSAGYKMVPKNLEKAKEAYTQGCTLGDEKSCDLK